MVPVYSKCIFVVVKKISHILFKLSAYLLIAAIALCVMFGNGTHVHTAFDHFSDHGDIHASVHAHHADTNYDRVTEFDGKDEHQHHTATVDLVGTFSQKTSLKSFSGITNILAVGEFSRFHILKEQNPILLDLPPPDLLLPPRHFSSLTSRGPPLG